MDRDGFAKALRALQQRRRPFEVTLLNGDMFEVHRPQALVVRGGGCVYFGKEDGIIIFSHLGVGPIRREQPEVAGWRLQERI